MTILNTFLNSIQLEDCELRELQGYYLGGYATGNRIAFLSLAEAKSKCLTGKNISQYIRNMLLTKSF